MSTTNVTIGGKPVRSGAGSRVQDSSAAGSTAEPENRASRPATVCDPFDSRLPLALALGAGILALLFLLIGITSRNRTSHRL